MTDGARWRPSRAALTTGWSIVGVGASVVTGVATARLLGPEDRGILAITLTVTGFMTLVGALGTNLAVRRLLPNNPVPIRSALVGLSAIMLLPLAALFAATSVVLGLVFNSVFFDAGIIIAVVVYGLLAFLLNQALDLLNAQGDIVASARVNSIGSIACAVLVVIVWAIGLDLLVVIYCYSATTLIRVLLALPRIGSIVRPFAEARSRAGVLLSSGLQLMGMNVGQVAAQSAGQIVVGAAGSVAEAGQFAVATTPASILRLPAAAVGQGAFYDAARSGLTTRVVVTRVLQVEAVLLPPAALLWLLADWLVPLLYGSEYSAAVPILRILILAELAFAPFLVLSRVVAASGSPWAASASGLVGSFVLVGTALMMLPIGAGVAVAWASVIAYVVMSGVALVAVLRLKSATPTDSPTADQPEN